MTDAPAVPLLADNVTKRFGHEEVLRGVSLRIDRGSVHGLVGLNGAGKTTLLECSLGLQPFNEGLVALLGRAPRELYRTHGELAAVFDSPCIHPNLSVRDVLEFARRTCGRAARDPRDIEDLLGIARYSDVKVRKLSLGNRRRTAIAQALIARPSFVILDEPFNGLDAGGVEDVIALIRDLNRAEGTTFLLASHQLSYLEPICSHVAVLHEGRLAANGITSELLATRKTRIRLRTADDAHAASLLQGWSGVVVATPSHDHDAQGLQLELGDVAPAAVNRALVQAGIDVDELVCERPSLERLFHEITGRTH
jgi:ABC-2 type transport system ATP-binding protein